MMTPLQVIFYVFAAIAMCSGIAVITVRHPVRSVLSLVVTFFAMAGVWMILRAEFLSLILLLVYVGAVMTLFLFVVMMLNVEREAKKSSFVQYLPWGILLVLFITGLIILSLARQYFNISDEPLLSDSPDYSNIRQMGTVLYTEYVYAFELAGVLLLAAIIAAITLTHRGPKQRKVQEVSKQINIDPKDRVRLIKMPPTSKPEKQ